MNEKFAKRMTTLTTIIDESLKKRDKINFKKLDNHAATVKSMQDTNAALMKILSDKVFEMNNSLHKFKEFIHDIISRTDNAMALVYDQRQESDKKHEELKGEATLTKAQV